MIKHRELRKAYELNSAITMGEVPFNQAKVIELENYIFAEIEKVCYKGRKVRLSSSKYVTVNRVNGYNVSCFQAHIDIAVWFDIDDLLK